MDKLISENNKPPGLVQNLSDLFFRITTPHCQLAQGTRRHRTGFSAYRTWRLESPDYASAPTRQHATVLWVVALPLLKGRSEVVEYNLKRLKFLIANSDFRAPACSLTHFL